LKVVRVVTPCVVIEIWSFGGPRCLHPQGESGDSMALRDVDIENKIEDGGSMVLQNASIHPQSEDGGRMDFRNVGTLPHHRTTSEPGRLQLEYSSRSYCLLVCYSSPYPTSDLADDLDNTIPFPCAL